MLSTSPRSTRNSAVGYPSADIAHCPPWADRFDLFPSTQDPLPTAVRRGMGAAAMPVCSMQYFLSTVYGILSTDRVSFIQQRDIQNSNVSSFFLALIDTYCNQCFVGTEFESWHDCFFSFVHAYFLAIETF